MSLLTILMNALYLSSIVTLAMACYFLYKANLDISKTLRSMRKELNLLRNADLSLGKQVQANQKINARLEERQDKLEAKQLNQGCYNQGLKILEMGGDVEDILKTCNLSRAEADLLNNMHAYKQAAKTD